MPAIDGTSRFEFLSGLDALPSESARLWQLDCAESYFLSRGWFESLLAAGMDAGDRVAVGALQSEDGRVLAVLPARFVGRALSLLRYRKLSSLTGMYACCYRPILAPDADVGATARSLGRRLASALTSHDIIALDALDGEWTGWPEFERGLRESGFSVVRYAHFGNWFEPMGGRSFEQYLAARGGSLREILRRRQRALERNAARFAVIASGEGLDKAIAAYEAVYARSWKSAEPYPRFHERLMRIAARDGVLRVGLCYIGERPAAAQIWIVWRHSATVLKLAHDREFDRYSPGSLLLAHMIRHVLEHDAATEIDFGRGDDPYKREWSTRRRQRYGLLAASPRSPVGLAVLLRHYAGRCIASAWRRG